MNRLGAVLAVAVAVVLIGGCGGGSESKPEATTATPVQLADVCPKIQDALDAAFAGKGGDPTGEDYQRFADDLATQIAVVDPKGEPLLNALQKATQYLISAGKSGSSAAEMLESRGEWLDAMKRVTDTCQQLGAPLS